MEGRTSLLSTHRTKSLQGQNFNIGSSIDEIHTYIKAKPPQAIPTPYFGFLIFRYYYYYFLSKNHLCNKI